MLEEKGGGGEELGYEVRKKRPSRPMSSYATALKNSVTFKLFTQVTLVSLQYA